MRKLLRTVLAVATFAVAWLVVSPAYAWTNLAPVCDPRGATTFAPPPQIQDAEQSLDIPDCSGDELLRALETKNVVRGHGARIDVSFSQEPVARAAADVPLFQFAVRSALVFDALDAPPVGVQSSVERPPRRVRALSS